MGLFGKKKSGKDWFDDGNNFYEQEKRNKISIPTYCFDHKRYWIEPSEKEVSSGLEGRSSEIKPNMEDWFYEPSWKKANLPKQLTSIIKKGDNCFHSMKKGYLG